MSLTPQSSDTIFCEAIEIASPDERDAYLIRACGGDDVLRGHVAKLIADHFRAGQFLEQPAASLAGTVDQPISERPGMVIGPYKLLEKVGEGGFGVVFMADQMHPVRRKVALKVIKPGMDTRQVIARFEAERQALALMDHPNIARVFDAGETEAGRPYFVMELVKGIPITEYCDQAHLTPRERLPLFVAVCQAVQHAHQKGIIHRDLKPTNVLVTLHDGTPVVKVIDFGVAKATNQQLTEKTLFTGFAQMVGTPLYMSPEQAALSGLDIDTRSDIYSLGVLLYELLTGTTPLVGEKLKKAAFDEIRRMIREEEPQRPSTRVHTMGARASTVSSQRKTEPHKLCQLLRNELDWIVMKALEKDRTRRYETASGLARDVERYLTDQAVEACPPSAAYRLSKFIRRNKVAFTTTTLVAAALLLGIAVSTSLAVIAGQQRNRALAASEERRLAVIDAQNAIVREIQAKEQQKILRQAAEEKRQNIERQNAEIVALNQKLRQVLGDQSRSLYVAQMHLIPAAWETDNIPWVLELLNYTRPRPGAEDLRGFEWFYWHKLCHSDLRTVRLAEDFDPGPPTLRKGQVAISADGTRIAVVRSGTTFQPSSRETSFMRSISVCDSTSGEVVWLHRLPNQQLDTDTGPTASTLGWISPDGKRVALCTMWRFGPSDFQGSYRLEVQMFEVGKPEPLLVMDEHLPYGTFGGWGHLAFSHDGTRLAALVRAEDREASSALRAWDASSGQPVAAIKIKRAASRPDQPGRQTSYRTILALNSDGTRAALFQGDEITVWDVPNASVLRQFEMSRVFSLDFSSEGSRLAVAGEMPMPTEGARQERILARILPLDPAEPPIDIPDASPYAELSFSPDGRWLALGSELAFTGSPSIQLISAATGQPGPKIQGHRAPVIAVRFTQGSARLVSVSADRMVKHWNLAAIHAAEEARTNSPARTPRGSARWPTAVTMSPDGTTFASVELPAFSPGPGGVAQPAALHEVSLLRTASREVVRKIEMAGPIRALGYCASSERLVVSAADPEGDLSQAGQILVVECATGQEVLPVMRVPALEPITFGGASPSRKQRLGPWAALSPDGKLLAYSLYSGTFVKPRTALAIMDLETQAVVTGDAIEGGVIDWEFSPDGSRVLGRTMRLLGALGSTSQPPAAVRTRGASGKSFAVYDAQTARLVWRGPDVSLYEAFSADGTQVYALCQAALRLPNAQHGWKVQIWHAADGAARSHLTLPISGSTGPITPPVVLSPDGKRLATVTRTPGSDVIEPDSAVRVWDVETHSEVFTLRGHAGQVVALAFSPDSRRIATSASSLSLGQQTGEIKLWDARSGREVLTLPSRASQLAFATDGRQLWATAGSLRTVFDASQASDEREASDLVEALLHSSGDRPLPRKSEALAMIAADQSLSEGTRKLATEQVRALRRNAEELNNAAWLIVRLPDQSPDDYARALEYAEEACAGEPQTAALWNTRGAACYRLNRYSDALTALERSMELTGSKPIAPTDFAFLAMTHFQLDHIDQAGDFLRRLRDAIPAVADAKGDELRTLLAEAERIIGGSVQPPSK